VLFSALRCAAGLAVATTVSTATVFLLLRRQLGADLEEFLAAGGRKVDQWFARHRSPSDLSHRQDSFVTSTTRTRGSASKRCCFHMRASLSSMSIRQQENLIVDPCDLPARASQPAAR